MAPPILWEKPGGLRAATSVIETFSSNTSSHPSLLPGLPSAPPPPPTNIPRANSADPPKVPVHLLHDTLRAHPLALEGLNPACPEATLHLIMSSAGDSVNEGIRCRGGRITLERDELCPEEPALDACNDCTRDVLPSFLPSPTKASAASPRGTPSLLFHEPLPFLLLLCATRGCVPPGCCSLHPGNAASLMVPMAQKWLQG